MTDKKTGLSGLRILVVEDEVLIAMDIEYMLLDLNCEPIGPASTIEAAIEIIRDDDKIDGVLLDMNLHGKPVHPIVEELTDKNLPFVLVTGYSRRDDDAAVMADAPRLNKPFALAALSEVLTTTLLK